MRTAEAAQDHNRAAAVLHENGTVSLSGRWTADEAPGVESSASRIIEAARSQALRIDLSELVRLDTLGAWVLERTRGEIETAGGQLTYAGASPEHRILLGEAQIRNPAPPDRAQTSR